MPLLEPRGGENDGGYAVMDYDAVDPQGHPRAAPVLWLGVLQRRA